MAANLNESDPGTQHGHAANRRLILSDFRLTLPVYFYSCPEETVL